MPFLHRHFSLRSRVYTILLVLIVVSIAIGVFLSQRVYRPRYLGAVELSLYETSSLVAALLERRTDRLYPFTDSLAQALKAISLRRQGRTAHSVKSWIRCQFKRHV
jgi:hypothetical protein